MEYIPYTYVIKFKPTGQLYYGVSFGHNRHKIANPAQLWSTYFTSSGTIRALLKQHGPDAFEATVRRCFLTKEAALQWEHKVLRRLNAASSDRWLNRSNGARTFYIDDETRSKMSAAKKGKPSPKRGIPISADQRAKISASRQGLKMSEEHNTKRSNKMKGEGNHMHGKHHSPETKQKIAEAAKRREEAKRLARQSFSR